MGRLLMNSDVDPTFMERANTQTHSDLPIHAAENRPMQKHHINTHTHIGAQKHTHMHTRTETHAHVRLIGVL